ncbi:MAG: hypothetical protein KGS45_03705 [Planctomycetes bacterium]|nr:hypothetical protein [Planctomycetota bacterium]
MRHLSTFAANDPLPAIERSYDNWRGTNRGGQTVRRGALTTGSSEYGDDLVFASTETVRLSDLGFTVANLANSGSITGFDLRIRIYSATTMEVLLDDFANYVLIGGGIDPGRAGYVFSEGGFFFGTNTIISTPVFITTQVTSVQGIDLSQVGVGYGGPINTGSSSSLIRNFTSGQNIDLGADPQNNLLFFIDSVVVPSPSSVSLLAASSLLALRRRRK